LADKGNPIIEKFYSDLKLIIKKRHQKNKIDKEILAVENDIKVYLIIIEEKLGSARLKELLKETNIIKSIDLLLSLLNKNEKEIVVNAYNNKKKLIKLYSENKCPHLQIYLKLRRCKNAAYSMKLLNDLLAYGDAEKNKKDWHMCKKCGYQLICPHVVDKLRAEVNLKSYEETLTLLNKYIKTTYTNDNISIYYCSICSEKISELETEIDFNKNITKFGDINNEIKIKIWSILKKSLSNVIFIEPINPNSFVNNATNVLYGIISKFHSINKSNLYDENIDDIDPLTILYCVIFSYAYILHKIFIQGNHDHVGYSTDFSLFDKSCLFFTSIAHNIFKE
jgi:hypothetical protein